MLFIFNAEDVVVMRESVEKLQSLFHVVDGHGRDQGTKACSDRDLEGRHEMEYFWRGTGKGNPEIQG